ncbi:bifunctional diaminohydroxyphosphoribosylaminopyrimidine deaminase/5-amino-6-(5-phosphoribosylamino)uracil reductase RibD [Albirhodobacter sp. R86504]|uniref:bifunctional diaminohydroxyphosphoribosylaminopyrimidine deaminase/5-amino-6-(5-phosphoribosylamino)uracil reductase RibD n=1 Tax=Albirhodobacter sp. R86504 TaxID=3093848 RepID=UPI0036706C1E
MDDVRYMRLALSLGRRGLGQTWPNPAVGCVIAKDDIIVGRGWTQLGGRPHAERVALEQAGDAARGATAYVTLEPCAHHGHTSPCAEALIDAGIARVVCATGDPDPRVAGRGFSLLRAAGIEVVEGLLGDEARADLRGFLSRITQGRPMLTLKLATSLDGRIATASGESQWITNPASRARVHGLRASHDAVIVGGGTARADDPLLTVRGIKVARQPVRIVAASTLDLPRERLAASLHEGPVWLFHTSQAPSEARAFWSGIGAELIEIEGPSPMSPTAILRALGDRGLTRVFCEGGGEFAASLLQAGLVDCLVSFTAGLVIGADGRSGTGAMGLTRLSLAPRFHLADVEEIDGDIMHTWIRT